MGNKNILQTSRWDMPLRRKLLEKVQNHITEKLNEVNEDEEKKRMEEEKEEEEEPVATVIEEGNEEESLGKFLRGDHHVKAEFLDEVRPMPAMEFDIIDNFEEKEFAALVDEQEKDAQKEENTPFIPLLVWKLPETSLSKGKALEEEIKIKSAGCYQIVFQRLDKLITRSLSIKLTILSHDGNVLSRGEGGLGGIKYTMRHCIEFRVEEACIVNFSFLCTALNPFGDIKFKGSMHKLQSFMGKAIQDTMISEFLPENSFILDKDGDNVPDTKEDRVIEALSHFNISKSKKIEFKLTEGHYYIGVRNDGESGISSEYKRITIDLKVYKEDDLTKLFIHDIYELKVGEFPWRKQFSITQNHGPVLCILTLSMPSKFKGIASLKIAETLDPQCFQEILKRNQSQLMKIFYIISILLILSYGTQLVSFLFQLQIPFTDITVRGICTVVAVVYGMFHFEQIKSTLFEIQHVIKEKISFLKKLDEMESGIQKLKYLQERSKIKRTHLQLKKKAKMVL